MSNSNRNSNGQQSANDGEGLPGVERRRYTAFYECGEEMRRPRPSQ